MNIIIKFHHQLNTMKKDFFNPTQKKDMLYRGLKIEILMKEAKDAIKHNDRLKALRLWQALNSQYQYSLRIILKREYTEIVKTLSKMIDVENYKDKHF